MLIEAQSDHATLVARNQEVQDTLDARRKEVDHLETQYNEILGKCRAARRTMEAMIPQLSEEERAFVGEHGRSKKIADVETNIASEEARLELMQGGSGRVLAEYEERAKRIEVLSRKQSAYEAALVDLNTNITRVREQWEPQLDNLVRRISDAFGFNMGKINCAGEAVIHKDPEFDQWAIQIRVKFRENEPLTQLDAHRQSGGERAVSTVFYLMSLQALTRSPFRVVDEINQGMDPRNERLVHSRMVAIATGNDEWEQHYREKLADSAAWRSGADQANGGSAGEDDGEEDGDDGEQSAAAATPSNPPPQGRSQYFLITPKLLHGLRYDEGMTVLCIASGEHMAGASAVDFGKALALRRQSGGGRRVAALG
jgi:structural maintenance of chromosomes protein 5